ncbi:MAG TPA: Rieske 2Fe-2S domain-containing protein, partial [Candidatus Obscuribacterales bacterium]
MSSYSIDPDITRARTLPGKAYCDPEFFGRQRERLFSRSWQFLPWVDETVDETVDQPADTDQVANVFPLTLLPGLLDEPLLLARQEQGWQLLANVCTHRGALLLEKPARCRTLRCPYHGRSFGLDGRMLAMPAFEAAKDFPGPADHLPRLPLERFGPFAFTALDPAGAFADWIRPLSEGFAWVPWQDFRFAPELTRDYDLAANWALYVDNYLEGLHIPYIHPALNQALDFKAYQIRVLDAGVLQVGLAAEGEACFALPADHRDQGLRIAAYYLWL